MTRLVLLIICMNCYTLFAQNEASTVYFGSCILDFRSYPFSIISNSVAQARESGTSYCNAAGDLLFYSNGGPSPLSPAPGGLWTSSFQTMSGSAPFDSAGCLSSASGAIAFPSPGSVKTSNFDYFLLTRDCLESSVSAPYFNSGLTLTKIDMSLYGGFGGVVSKYECLVPYAFVGSQMTNHEPVTAVLHPTEPTYWIYSYTNNELYRMRCTQTGFDSFTPLFAAEGVITVAPDRTHMMVGTELYSLDPLTGELSFSVSFPTLSRSAFSPDGTKLYINDNGSLIQYDLTAIDVLSSSYVINTVASSAQLFLTPNGRILCFQNDATVIDAQVICPNNTGASCAFDGTDLSLNGGHCPTIRPNLLSHLLYQQGGSCSLGLDETSNDRVNAYYHSSDQVVTFSEEYLKDIRIVDVTGRTLYSGNYDQSDPISTQLWTKGWYFISAGSGSVMKVLIY